MNRNATEMERAVARTLRDSLEKLQRNTDEVNQAVGDLTSACASARPTNTLPHILRAQSAAASLASSLDILARFITSALQTAWMAPSEQQESSPERAPEQNASAPIQVAAPLPVEQPQAFKVPVAYQAPAPEIPEPATSTVDETLRTVASETQAYEQAGVAPPVASQPEPQPVRRAFDVAALPAHEQELHRRASRVAKVSMQDIKMLRPGEVQLGKENNDLCARLRDDIERAHKEYERRFHAILDHPVDYFYAWMVEILGEGDPRALGEYPYPSPVARR
jgi:hypothetical protein